MRIGIDIDDTITDTKECVINYKKIAYPNLDPYKLLPNNLYDNFMKKYELIIHENVKLKDYAAESIRDLSLNNEIIFITSRGKKSENITREYLKRHNIPYNNIFFDVIKKGNKAKSINLDIFIDDHAFICKQMEEVGIKAIKMHRDDEIYEGLEFSNWIDLLKYLKKED